MLWGIYSAIYGEVNVSVEKCVEIKGDCWKIAKLFYFCHLKKLARPETFGSYHVRNIPGSTHVRIIHQYVTRTLIFLNTQKRKLQLTMLRPIKHVNKIKFLTMPQAVNGHSLFAQKLNWHTFRNAVSRVTKLWNWAV